MSDDLIIKHLESGYIHARGYGVCNWAQWPGDRPPTDDDFFPEAGEEFRAAVRKHFTPDDEGRV